MLMYKGRRLASTIAVGLVLAATAAGCGSDDEDPATTTKPASAGAGATGGAQAEAKAEVEKFSPAQPAITIPKLTKPVPEGVDVAFISCPVPVCVSTIKGAEAAAKAVGWKSKTFQAPLTPEGYAATWTNVLRSKPDAIAYIGGNFPNETVASQLEEAKSQGIPVVGLANAEAPDDLVPAVYNGSPQFVESGRLQAALIAAEAGSDADVLYVDPQLPTFADMKKKIYEGIKAVGGKISDLTVNLQGIGKTIPAQLVSHLQSHPSTNYVVLALNDLSVGVTQALQAAGLADKVKIVSRAPSPAALADVKSGAQYAAVAEETAAMGWRAIDGLIRLKLKDDISCCTYPAGWHQILTAKTVTQTKTFPATPGEPESFRTAWGLK